MAYTNVFVLGDSLVDAGNALELAEWYGGLPLQDLPEGAPVAEDGYFLGRFSDGYNFADLIANKAIGTVTEPISPTISKTLGSAFRSIHSRPIRAGTI